MSEIEKVPRGFQGKKSSKDMVSSRFQKGGRNQVSGR